MAAPLVSQASEKPPLNPPPPLSSVEVRYLPVRVIQSLEEWIEQLIGRNGGFGEVNLEINEGRVRRIRPTESWMADKL